MKPRVAVLGGGMAGLAAAWFCGGRAELRALWSQALRWRVEAYWFGIALFLPILLWWLRRRGHGRTRERYG